MVDNTFILICFLAIIGAIAMCIVLWIIISCYNVLTNMNKNTNNIISDDIPILTTSLLIDIMVN